MDQPAIEVRDLVVGYGSAPVLDGLSLEVPRGTATCVIGENGAGKSTLLRTVSGLQRPEAGSVLVLGREPGTDAEHWRQVVTTVEPPSWYPGLTAREHAELVTRAHGLDDGDAAAERAFELLGLAGHEDSMPTSLSSGQKQRLTLAMAFVRPSRVLILDEPEQRLDPDARSLVAGLLRDYVAGGGTVLLASHDEKFAAGTGALVTSVAELCGP
ncbi:ABC transporter ATP-binding protein [Spirilliplanes yamanashiensis]|uniref:ABC transporter ATP-binding protein n=1 Tax=Spirilliplanes yamanashiensis TaxID=42233 RepID=A0A8J3Y4A5_9ACTN|nr:ABC transporter ATP-binding protein [Spirilliplanes yamanashiensis]MDP9819886.1 ABC-type multidrug transport system ATPase subunit [Spirilliplanes yamanashiensis]GIJ01295.1 ABC transporter ATP-binding protein [Spirilliplanes yamanashiensis]